MRPEKSLPYSDEFKSADDYVEQLLRYVASTPVFQVLCGGVHIMDFYTSDPGLFYSVVPEDWQVFLLDRAPMELLDFLLRDDVDTPREEGRVPPPASLIQYVRDVRRFSLQRNILSRAATEKTKLPRKITMGMNIKKIHEVTQFSAYVDRLADAVSEDAPSTPITHLVDVGSGQNYLGRALASKSKAPQDSQNSSKDGRRGLRRGVVAVESKGHNIAGAKGLDMMTGVMAAPARPMRNKKLYQQMLSEKNGGAKQTEKARNRIARSWAAENTQNGDSESTAQDTELSQTPEKQQKPPSTIVADMRSRNEIAAEAYAQMQQKKDSQKEQDGQATEKTSANASATDSDNLIQYVEGRLENGDLSHVLSQVQPLRQDDDQDSDLPSSFLTVSIHSCGNLSHYGLRALELNPDVRAVAIVGCCYNLLTERLGPPTYKVPGMRPRPTLQPVNGRVMREEERRDPEGFPMSARFATYSPSEGPSEKGIRFNITARMMACQAPANWTEADSESFFTRHFYRAILQRIFLDRGVLQRVRLEGQADDEEGAAVSPIIIGSLRKACYASLSAYVRGAVAKIAAQGNGNGAASSDENAAVNAAVAEKMASLTDEDLEDYNTRYGNAQRRRELSAVWSLMAFSAGVVESAIVADRWQYLREQQAKGLVRDCWVESVFSYDQSPRNLVVVGIRGEKAE
ncbi:hypothetical protein SEUCBS139899_006253 [Sporothrix eucalyptigena]